jgi:hypothetical protein
MKIKNLISILGVIASFVTAGSNAKAGEVYRGQIDGDFNGWEGDTVYKLMDGPYHPTIYLSLSLSLRFYASRFDLSIRIRI